MVKEIYCSQCGDPSPLGQKFCEKCGSRLPEEDPLMSQGSSAISNQPTTIIPMDGGALFNPAISAYVLKEKYWDFGSGPIYDHTGQQIGKMKRKLLSIRSRIELFEMNGQLATSINRKLIAIKPTYTLHDNHENIIGRFQKTLLSIINPKFYLKDPDGNILLTAQGKFMGFDFNIYDNQGISVAEIHKADRWRDVFFSGGWDFGDTYGVKIHSPDIDRRLLLGFVIAIDNVLHDN
jgi:uncharacterized protein YxjI